LNLAIARSAITALRDFSVAHTPEVGCIAIEAENALCLFTTAVAD
jgi:hypothetical protein